MSAGRRVLLDRRGELVTQLRRKRVPRWAWPELPDLVERVLEAWAGRAEVGRLRAASRSIATRDLIRNALGAAPLDCDVDVLVRLATLRLGKRAPAKRTMRPHIREIQKDGGTELERRAKRNTVSDETINAKGTS